MSGTLKVGGVPLATHTGTDGLVTGMSWGSSVPAGTVIQTQTNSITTSVEMSAGTSSSPTWVDVITKAITPASGTKIIVCFSFLLGNNDVAAYAMWRILKDSTTINVNTDTSMVQWINEAARNPTVGNFISTNIVDLHGADGSTAVTYKLQVARQATNHVYVGHGYSNSSAAYGAAAATHITLFEVQT